MINNTKKITVIYGPPGSWKTTIARGIAALYAQQEVYYLPIHHQKTFDCTVPPGTKLMIVDEWPACVPLPLTKSGAWNGAPDDLHVIVCTQFNIQGFKPFNDQYHQLKYIETHQ